MGEMPLNTLQRPSKLGLPSLPNFISNCLSISWCLKFLTPGYFDLGSTHFSFFLSARQLVILLSRELVLVNVMVGIFDGVVVRTFSMWERSVALFEEEAAVEDVGVLSGEARPRARRRRDLRGIARVLKDVLN